MSLHTDSLSVVASTDDSSHSDVAQAAAAEATTAQAPTEQDASALRAMTGPVTIHLPGDPGYDGARAMWNTSVDLYPAAVAEPTTALQVSDVVTAARRLGLRVAPVSTGHNAGPLVQHDLSSTVLLTMSRMTAVSVDPSSAAAHVQGGALWGDVIEAAGHHGLACLHGSSPDVGVGGYLLGGGIFLYGRRLGMATNSLTGVEIVLADGSLIRADHSQHQSLFWALRGGGGNFGIVTSFEFSLYPIASVHAGMMVWDIDDAERVIRAWAHWAPGAPDEITTSMRILNLPDAPEVPGAVRGRPVVCLDGAVLGPEDRAQKTLDPLRRLRPEVDTFAQVPPWSLARLHMDPEGPTPVVGDSTLLGTMPDEAVDAFLSQVGPGTEHVLLTAELRQLGAALSRRHPEGGAMNRLDGNFMLFGAAVADTPENRSRGHADALSLVQAMSPWSTGKQYLNFAEAPVDPELSYGDREWLTLTRVKSVYDPDDVFAANHPVPPA
ncbi:FAD-binding oxidoreductase [Brevibacterium yomogidense]|uniref:Probable oxidoreductase n=1 Tax=Brevibacterium yomogidense TaxID=946573 RepID=A0A1X6XDI1_9MICO|nr:FAD-binding oxidoreductase [Brevibacterium yomogidense]SLM97238.1 probable oxidoreductase [Brevibacterium yomogidense]